MWLSYLFQSPPTLLGLPCIHVSSCSERSPLMAETVSENQDSQNSRGESENKTDCPKQEVSSAVTKSELPPTQREGSKPRKKQRDWYDYTTGVLEIIGLVVLCIYASYTIKIYCATKKAADAATDAANTAKESLHTTQRAYIDIKTPELNVINDPQGKFFAIGVRFEWENSGLTRAPYMVEHLNIGKLPYILPKKYSFPDRCGPNKKCISDSVQGVLPSRRSAGDSLSPITASELQLMVANKLHVYCWGWNAYRDVFYPVTKTHLTEFCTELGFTNPIQYQDGHPMILAWNCKIHNCADEDCEDYRDKTEQRLPVTPRP